MLKEIPRRSTGAASAVALAVVIAGAFGACRDNSSPNSAGPVPRATDGSDCTKLCNGACVSAGDPSTGCAGTSCVQCPNGVNEAAVCVAGTCGVSCVVGFDDCDKTTPGCETRIANDPNNCGGCGHTCNSVEASVGDGATPQNMTCVEGTCMAACPDGYARCDRATPACDTRVAGDPNNCGSCGHVCGTTNATSVSCGDPTTNPGAGDASTDAGASAGVCHIRCSGAYAHCSQDDSTGCETPVGTDPTNCGACGHSCGGGDCAGGYCLPVILTGDPTKPTGLKSLYGLVTLYGNLYGTSWESSSPAGGIVYQTSTTPGAPLRWIVGGGGAVGSGTAASAQLLATDGASLTYSIFHVGEAVPAGIWNVHVNGDQNTLDVSGGTTGGGPACDQPSAFAYEVQGVAFDSNFVYWIRDTYGGCFPSTLSCQCKGIYRANADGTGVVPYFTSNWYTLPVADSGSLYMIDYLKSTVVVANSATFTNNSPPTVLPQRGTPAGIQTDATYVYWIDDLSRKFYRAAKVGATVADDITPATGMPVGPLWSHFLVDANQIYFVSPPPTPNTLLSEQIYAMPKDGSGPARALPGAFVSALGDSISAWTQDASALYWTTYGLDNQTAPFAALYKLAK